MTDANRAGHRWSNAAPTLRPDWLLSKQLVDTAKEVCSTDLDFPEISAWAPRRAPDISVSACSALLRQGRRDGWDARSYHRVAAYFEYADPIAAGMWAGFAKGVR